MTADGKFTSNTLDKWRVGGIVKVSDRRGACHELTGESPMKKTFEQWMSEVDQAVISKTGLSVHDLADCPFMDWWEDGKTAKGAASRAIKMMSE